MIKSLLTIGLLLILTGCEKQPLSEKERADKKEFILDCVAKSGGAKNNVVQCDMIAYQLYNSKE